MRTIFCLLALMPVAFIDWLFATQDPQRLARMGDSAFDRGEYERALEYYNAAAVRVTDPGLIAFNKGVLCYRLGDYAEAAVQFDRSRENATGERVAEAAYNLGNSLVQLSQQMDVDLLTRAIRCYEDCLKARPGAELEADAQVNLRLARELLQQARSSHKPRHPNRPEPPQDADEPPARRSGMEAPEMADDQADQNAGVRRGESGASEPGQEGTAISQRPPPGKGNLPPIPDQDRLQPMSSAETSAYLDRAVQRIMKTRHSLNTGFEKPTWKNVPDW